MKPTVTSLILRRILWWVCAISVVAFVSGCSGAAPRFRAAGASKDVSRSGGTDALPPPLLKEKEEERAEDDRTVNVDAALSSLSGEVEEKALEEITGFLGTPYSLGGVDHGGIDCSGFTAAMYSRVYAIPLPHSTSAQYASSAGVETDEKRFGDLVFFRTGGDDPSHVGFYLGENLFAHASVSSGVTISSLESSYYKRRFIGVRRVRK